MKKKILLNHKLVNSLIEKVHEENLPVEINTGEQHDGLIDVLLEYPDTFHEAFEPMMNNAFSDTYGILEENWL